MTNTIRSRATALILASFSALGFTAALLAVLSIVAHVQAANEFLQFSAATYTVDKLASSLVVTVTLAPVSATDTISVDVSSADGTASGLTDYAPVSTTLAFLPNTSAMTLTIPITASAQYVGNKDFSLTLTNPISGAVGTPATATVTIVDNSAPIIALSPAAYSVGKNGGTATLTATLSGATALPASVDYATSDGTAQAGTDYAATSGTLLFTPGQSSLTFTVPVSNAGLYTGDLNFNVALSNVQTATLGAATALVTLTEVNSAPVLALNSATASVNKLGGQVVLTASLAGTATTLPVTAHYTTVDETALAGADYTAISGTLTFPAGTTTRPINVTILGNPVYDVDKTFSVTLSTVTNAQLGVPSASRVTIVDTSVPSVALSAPTYSVNKNGGTAAITATLTGATALPAVVHYATSDGTALANTNYLSASGAVTLTSGAPTKVIDVIIIDHQTYEGDRSFNFALSNPSHVVLGAISQTVVTIKETYPQPAVTWAATAYTFTKDSGAATFTVNLVGATDLPASVSYATSDGTALAGLDYAARSGTLLFAPGQSSLTVTVPVSNAHLYTGGLNFNLTLSNPLTATLGAFTSTVATLTETNAPPTVSLSPAAYLVNKNSGQAVITATLSGNGTTLPVTVAYATSDDTAHAGSDYAAQTGVLNFTPGARALTITVPISDNLAYEGNTNFKIGLSQPATNVTLGTADAAVTIAETHAPPVIALSAPAYSVNKDGGQAVITATLTGATVVTASATYTTSNGAALAGIDYTAVTGTITFAPNVTVTTFNVPILGNPIYDVSKAFNLLLSAPVSATLNAGAQAALVTIVENSPLPVAQFAQSNYNALDNSGSALITVTLNTQSTFPISLTYATSAGTALPGTNYTDVSGVLQFAPLQTTGTFTVPVIPSGLAGDVAANLSLSNPSNATLGVTNPASLTILSTAGITPTIRLTSATYSANKNAGSLTVGVFITLASNYTVTVDLSSTDGTASHLLHYAPVSATLAIPSGPANFVGTYTIAISNNVTYDTDRTFTLTLSNPTYATLGTTNISAIATIKEVNPKPEAQFSASGLFTTTEGTALKLPVTLDRPSTFTTQVTYATADGSALASRDYAAANGTLTFGPNVTVQTITVPISNNLTYTGNLTFSVNLNGATNATLGTIRTATATVLEGNSPPAIQLSAAGYTVNKNGTSLQVPVTLTGNTAVPAKVNYATANGTAFTPGDYTGQAGQLTFPAGTHLLTITVPIIDNGIYGLNKTFSLSLSNAISATLGAPSSATITITETNPKPTIQFNMPSYSLLKSQGVVSVTAIISGRTSLQALVNVATSNGTALAGVNYTAKNVQLTFLPNAATSQVVTFTVNTGPTYTRSLNFNVGLSSPTNASLGPIASAPITITETNPPPAVQFSLAGVSVGKSSGQALVAVSLSGNPTAVPAKVNYATADGTATAGGDYTATSGTLTFSPGTTVQTITVPLLNLTQYTGNRVFNFQPLSGLVDDQLGGNQQAAVTIAETNARAGCVIYNSVNVPIAIPDNNTTGVTSQVIIPTPGRVITDITVRIDNLPHTFTGDLRLDLKAPDGTSVSLIGAPGVGGKDTSGRGFQYLTFNDAAPGFTGNPNAQTPYTNAFHPFGNLSTLNGGSTAGTWQLKVADVSALDVGTLKAWGLELCGTTIIQGGGPTTVYLPLITH